MNKILLSLVIIGIVGGVTAGLTTAYFSDTETSEGNTFIAGTLDFKIVSGETDTHRMFNVSNLKPGQIVENYLVVVNDSTEDMDMRWEAWIPDFEAGILDDMLEVRFTMNPDDYDGYTALQGDGYTIAGPAMGAAPSTDWKSIDQLAIDNKILIWDYNCCEIADGDCEGGNLDEPFRDGWAGVYKIEVRMLSTAGNAYQGASFTGDMNFHAVQCEDSLD